MHVFEYAASTSLCYVSSKFFRHSWGDGPLQQRRRYVKASLFHTKNHYQDASEIDLLSKHGVKYNCVHLLREAVMLCMFTSEDHRSLFRTYKVATHNKCPRYTDIWNG